MIFDYHFSVEGGRLRLVKPRCLLVVSVVLNLGLALWLTALARKPAGTVAAATNPSVLAVGAAAPSAALPPPETQWVTNRFDWSQLKSVALDEFVANLRRVGCPPRTIRDLLLARVERLRRARERELKFSTPFWLAGRQRELATRGHAAQLRALDRELAATVRRLIGEDWTPRESDRQDLIELAVMRFFMGPMTEEQFAQVNTWMRSLEVFQDEMNAQTGGIWLAEDYARWRALVTREVERCRGLLAPAQFEEFVARTALMGDLDDIFEPDVFHLLPITPDELRRLSLASAEIQGWPRELLDFTVQEGPEAEAAELQELLLQQRCREILGEDRYRELERVKDSDYRAILEVVIENKLPREKALAAFEVRQLVHEEAARVGADPTRDDAARQEQLAVIAISAQASLVSLLGETAYQEYLRNSGQWLTNLNQL